MRIAIGEIAHETNTFSSEPTDVAFFQRYTWDHEEEILKNHTGVRNFLGGMIDKASELNIDIVPTFAAQANPSGIITKETFATLKNELFSKIRETSEELDAICLSLHGAGVAEGADDLEGELLASLREIVGYDIPIVVTLDLHANLTEKMVKEADLLLGVNHYPHTDCYDRGLEAVELAAKLVKKEINPKMNLVKVPLMIAPSTTYQSPAKDINEICWRWEEHPDVIDCTFFHGFCHTDIPEVSVSLISIVDNDEELAKQIGTDVANKIWEIRDLFSKDILSPEEGLQQAMTYEEGPIVINETSDNPGGGTPGDGTYLLKAMLELNSEKTCFGFIYDPEVAEMAHNAGEGAEIHIQLGGKTDKQHGGPLHVTAIVEKVTDGQFTHSSMMLKGKKANFGKCARLKIGEVDVIVSSKRSQTFDEQIFKLHDIDVTKYKIVALKSSQHFRASFESIGKAIITVNPPGLSSSNLFDFPFKRVNRPIYPLDEQVSF
jgi:microcystin degradation protein MlrC